MDDIPDGFLDSYNWGDGTCSDREEKEWYDAWMDAIVNEERKAQ
jgi:hypothetical protein